MYSTAVVGRDWAMVLVSVVTVMRENEIRIGSGR
jgi:hypothetical protein